MVSKLSFHFKTGCRVFFIVTVMCCSIVSRSTVIHLSASRELWRSVILYVLCVLETSTRFIQNVFLLCYLYCVYSSLVPWGLLKCEGMHMACNSVHVKSLQFSNRVRILECLHIRYGTLFFLHFNEWWCLSVVQEPWRSYVFGARITHS
jgi:hypothetical protein